MVMNMDGSSRNTYQIVKGDQPRVIRGIEARKKIARELHAVVLQTPVPKEQRAYLYDLRRGRRHIWGGLLRFIDVSVLTGVARSTLLVIPRVIAHYIEDACDARDGRREQDEAA